METLKEQYINTNHGIILEELGDKYYIDGNFLASVRSLEIAKTYGYTPFRKSENGTILVLGYEWTTSIGHCSLLDFVVKAKILNIFTEPVTGIRLYTYKACINNLPYLLRFSNFIDITILEDIDAYKSLGLDLTNSLNIAIYPVKYSRIRLDYIYNFANYVQREWDLCGYNHLDLSHSEQHDETMWKRINDLYNIKQNDKIITLHVRHGPTGRDGLRAGRNANIYTYMPMILHLISLGYKVIRLGDKWMPKLPHTNGLVDLAVNQRREFADDDFFLKIAQFHIGTQSGPMTVACTHGKPTLFTNQVSVLTASYIPYQKTIYMPKVWVNIQYKTLVPLNQWLTNTYLSSSERASCNEFRLIDNTEEDLLNGAKLLDKLNNGNAENEDIHTSFKEIIPWSLDKPFRAGICGFKTPPRFWTKKYYPEYMI